MLIINKLIPGARGLAPALVKRAAQVELDWDTRGKSRFDARDSAGRELGIFLHRGTVVRGGDVLVAEDGSLVLVRAALQALLVVRHCQQHGSPFDLLRAAYHLGNRHVALELQSDCLLLEPDHVLAEMLRAMHLIVSEEAHAFEPESGAYSGHKLPAQTQTLPLPLPQTQANAHDCGHDHDRDRDHQHDHRHGHEHPHDHRHGHGHEHGSHKP